jgi:hypothetical protein
MVRITAFVKGFIEGLRTPLDQATMVFVEAQRKKSIPLKLSSPES